MPLYIGLFIVLAKHRLGIGIGVEGADFIDIYSSFEELMNSLVLFLVIAAAAFLASRFGQRMRNKMT